MINRLYDRFRHTGTERPNTSGEPSGSGARHARPTHQEPAPRPACPVRSAAVDVAAAEKRAGRPDRSHILSADHRQHTDGESLVRHVQELTTSPKTDNKL